LKLRVVSNSTPLIALSRIRRLHLLRELFNEVTIPAAVYEEVVSAGKGRAGGVKTGGAEGEECGEGDCCEEKRKRIAHGTHGRTRKEEKTIFLAGKKSLPGNRLPPLRGIELNFRAFPHVLWS